MKVPNDEEIANHIVPESCAAYREVRREALTGVRVGQPSSCVNKLSRAPTLYVWRKATRQDTPSQVSGWLGVVKDPGMRAHSLHGNREISGSTSRYWLARIGKARSRSR